MRTVERRYLFRKAFAEVTQRDLRPVIRQDIRVGWQGDPRKERRNQARAIAAKWWRDFQVQKAA